MFINTLIKRSLVNPAVLSVSTRSIFSRLGLESTEIAEARERDGLMLWEEQAQSQNALVLKTNDEIEKYVLGICKDYFRTTQKADLNMESSLKAHGLDPYDLIELVIQVEDDLGYLIDAENLNRFQKPKHFVNFITQIEAYRSEFDKLPHENTKASLDLKSAFSI